MRNLCLAVLLMTVAGVAGQEKEEQEQQLTADMQLMSRGEVRYGGMPAASDESTGDRSNFVLGRARLIIDYKRPELETKMNVQHLGVWGQAGKGAFNVFEAWARLNAKNGLFLQAGRQALAYDDERIIGPNDWSVAGQSHDALKLGYEGRRHKAHVILAFNQNAENMNSGNDYYVGGAQPYKAMQTGWYHYDFGSIPLGVSLLVMNIGMQAGTLGNDEHTEWQQIVGAYAKYKADSWSLEGSYYNQGGKNEEGGKIKAWMASVKGTWAATKSYGFEGGFDFLSGDKLFAVPPKGGIGLVRHDVIRGFNPMYGSHHQFYGAMDFFYVSTYVNGFTPGLQNAFIGGYYKPVPRMKIGVDYHYLATATDLIDMKKTLGHEIELRASYQMMKDASIALGYSYMAGTETMERLKRATSEGSLQWAWLSLNVSPRIFSIKWRN